MANAARSGLPAILGGEPLLPTPRSSGQLPVPPLDDYLATVRRSYELGRLSRGGIAVRELETWLTDFHGVDHVVTVASATLGLIMTLRLLSDERRGSIVMPSFTYPGLPHIARWAGQTPRFVEVDAQTHTLDVAAVAAALDAGGVSAVLPVCNHNHFSEIDALSALAQRYGVPIVFDAVDGLGGSNDGAPLGAQGHACVFSLHATKSLNGYEGGYITTNDAGLAAKLRWLRDGGAGTRPPGLPSGIRPLAVPLNELHAAMALGCTPRIAESIGALRERHRAYAAMTSALPGLRLLPVRDDDRMRSAYAKAVVEAGAGWPLSRDETVSALRAELAMSTPYYGSIHRSSHAPRGVVPPDLPVTDALAERFFHLPWGTVLTFDEIDRIGERLALIAARADQISSRLHAKPQP